MSRQIIQWAGKISRQVVGIGVDYDQVQSTHRAEESTGDHLLEDSPESPSEPRRSSSPTVKHQRSVQSLTTSEFSDIDDGDKTKSQEKETTTKRMTPYTANSETGKSRRSKRLRALEEHTTSEQATIDRTNVEASKDHQSRRTRSQEKDTTPESATSSKAEEEVGSDRQLLAISNSHTKPHHTETICGFSKQTGLATKEQEPHHRTSSESRSPETSTLRTLNHRFAWRTDDGERDSYAEQPQEKCTHIFSKELEVMTPATPRLVQGLAMTGASNVALNTDTVVASATATSTTSTASAPSAVLTGATINTHTNKATTNTTAIATLSAIPPGINDVCPSQIVVGRCRQHRCSAVLTIKRRHLKEVPPKHSRFVFWCQKGAHFVAARGVSFKENFSNRYIREKYKSKFTREQFFSRLIQVALQSWIQEGAIQAADT